MLLKTGRYFPFSGTKVHIFFLYYGVETTLNPIIEVINIKKKVFVLYPRLTFGFKSVNDAIFMGFPCSIL